MQDLLQYHWESNVYWTMHHCNSWGMKNQLDVTCYFISLVLQPAKRTPPNISRSKTSNTQRTENNTTDVVTHQHSRRLLKMVILMSETCWAHNKWNKIASDVKLVFHSSTIEKFWVSWKSLHWKPYFTYKHLYLSSLSPCFGWNSAYRISIKLY